MQDRKLTGLILIVVGLIMLFFGWQGSESIGDQLTESLTGRFTDQTMILIIAGAVSLIAGIYLSSRSGK